jgi:membrane-bound transcription factor site-1 protease
MRRRKVSKSSFIQFILYFLLLRITDSDSYDQLIITFIKKSTHDHHVQYLQTQLPCFESVIWTVAPRPLLMKNLITEYLVISISHQIRTQVHSCLLSDSMIRSIDDDSFYERNILQEAPSHSSSSSPPSHQHHLNHSSSFFPSSLSDSIPSSHGSHGAGLQIAIFDTGLSSNHPFFKVYERYDWTTEDSFQDPIGHGTFIAGILANTSPDCPGMVPNSFLHIFRIFTKNQKSYTSWFLDAFNYVIFLKLHIINLSIGGPDHNDLPFRSKIDEMSENGIIIISAIGNMGPIWGTATSPGDQNSVLGIGGWKSGHEISVFSSRGMSVWEIPSGVGRFKPDLVAPSVNIISISSQSPYHCYALSGTSVATPLVTGVVAILLSSLPSRSEDLSSSSSSSSSRLYREDISNIAAMKQILMNSAQHLESPLHHDDPHSNSHTKQDHHHTPTIFEQGAGLLDLRAAYSSLHDTTSATIFSPHVSFWPSRVSNHPKDCPYFWPYCDQELYPLSQPLLLNVTLLNSVAVTSGIYRIEYIEQTEDYGDSLDGISFDFKQQQSQHQQTPHHHRLTLHGNILDLKVDFSDILWPWCGTMGISVSTSSKTNYVGNVTGTLTVYVGDLMISETLTSSSSNGPDFLRKYSTSTWREDQKASLEFDLRITKPPSRSQRILWDVYHSLSYPSPFVPNDSPADLRSIFPTLSLSLSLTHSLFTVLITSPSSQDII